MALVDLPAPADRVTKPEPWDWRPFRVAPEWQWARDGVDVMLPFWHRVGAVSPLRDASDGVALNNPDGVRTNRYGNALGFSGGTSSDTDTWINVPGIVADMSATDFTMFFQCTADESAVTDTNDLYIAVSTGTAVYLYLNNTGGGAGRLSAYNGGLLDGGAGAGEPEVGETFTAAAVKRGSSYTIYYNGRPIASSSSYDIGATSDYKIGDGSEGGRRMWSGSMGVHYFWPRAKSDAEIAQLDRDPFGWIRPQERIVVSVAGGAQTISAPVAAATAEASAPQVAPATSVSAPGASASAEAPPPSLAASVDLAPPVAPGVAEAPSPTLSPGDPTPSAPVAPALAEAPAPSVASGQSVPAPVAVSTADAPAPTPSTTVTVSLPVAPSAADATAPSVVQGTSLALTVAAATAEANPPTVSPGAATVSLEAAQAIADAAEPQVAASVGVSSPVADVDVTALPPSVQAAISLAAAGADVEATAAAPQVSPGTATPSVPVATVTVTVLDVTVIAGELFVNTVTGEVFIARSLSGDGRVVREAGGDVGIAQTLSGDVEV